MGMSIKEAIPILHDLYNYYNDADIDAYVGFDNEDNNAIEVALDTMRKYQKIKEQVDIAIDTENFAISGARLIQIREIINGNDD